MSEAMSAGGIPEVGQIEQPEPTGAVQNNSFQTLVGTLDPSLAANPNIQRHSDMDSMAKEYVNLVSKIGEKGLIPPKRGDEADRERFYNELGRPASPGEYNFGDFSIPEGLPWDDNVGMQLVKEMWDQGLTQDQVPPLVQKYAEMQQGAWQQREQAAVQANQQTVSNLQQELGSAYTERMNMAHRAVTEYFGSENVDNILSTRLENGVQLGDWMPFVKAMMSASGSLREDELHMDPTKATMGAKTPEEADREMQELMADNDFRESYLDPQHPNHKIALLKMDELYAYKGDKGSVSQIGVGSGINVGVTTQGNPG
tara:strand:- start:16436 stop:17377 length:942 start_codon:yes stop_codon:yes gene_type:complete